MPNLFLDIETVPNIEAKLYLETQKRIERGELTKESKDKNLYWKHQIGALNPIQGKVTLITYRINDAHIFRLKEWELGEKEILNKFFETLSNLLWGSSDDKLRIIGHNILSFDIPFLYKRINVNNIAKEDFVYQRLIRKPLFIDFLQIHLSINNFSSLGLKHDVLAHAYNLPIKEEQGSSSIEYYFEKKYDKVLEYSEKEFIYPEMYKKMLNDGLVTQEKLKESIEWYNNKKSN